MTIMDEVDRAYERGYREGYDKALQNAMEIARAVNAAAPRPMVVPQNQKLVRINGATFRCECGANVFTKEGGRYYCNGCDAVYEGE